MGEPIDDNEPDDDNLEDDDTEELETGPVIGAVVFGVP